MASSLLPQLDVTATTKLRTSGLVDIIHWLLLSDTNARSKSRFSVSHRVLIIMASLSLREHRDAASADAPGHL
jgi:hypothetical protein